MSPLLLAQISSDPSFLDALSLEIEPTSMGELEVDCTLHVEVSRPTVVTPDRLLPSGARVGTVGKFQGQEAPIVLISMATSSGDDLPRHIEFLFSRNRLNVAISRARCLAVIIASPRLLEIQCSRIEQIELVNTLCWAKRYLRNTGRS